MTTHFTPQWKDDKGNVLIFPARNTLFDDYHEASIWQIGQFIFLAPFGLRAAGILEFEATDGQAQIVHIAGTCGMLGDCCIISGPDGPTEHDRQRYPDLANAEPAPPSPTACTDRAAEEGQS